VGAVDAVNAVTAAGDDVAAVVPVAAVAAAVAPDAAADADADAEQAAEENHWCILRENRRCGQRGSTFSQTIRRRRCTRAVGPYSSRARLECARRNSHAGQMLQSSEGTETCECSRGPGVSDEYSKERREQSRVSGERCGRKWCEEKTIEGWGREFKRRRTMRMCLIMFDFSPNDALHMSHVNGRCFS
jgi:hypothetical protein